MARDALLPLRLPEPDEILRWAAHHGSDHDGGTSKLAFELFAANEFVIEAVVWPEGFTTLVDVVGAIAIVRGACVHRRGRSEDERSLAPDFVVGRTQTLDLEILEAGDVRTLEGDFHVFASFDRPVVALVVRRRRARAIGRRQVYRSPRWTVTLAQPPALMKRFDAFSCLRTVDDGRFWRVWAAEARAMDLACFYLVLFILVGDADRKRVAPVLRAARTRHGEKVDALLPACEEHLRQGHITRRWSRARSVDHELLCALLAMTTSRRQLLDLVRRRHPARDPAAAVTEWIRELDPPSLGLDTAGMKALRRVLDGRPIDTAAERRLRSNPFFANVAERS